MPNTICLTGPAFSLNGDTSYTGNVIAFMLSFNTEADAASVLAFEWFLDGELMVGQSSAVLDAEVSCGGHTIGIRILSASGWSAVKSVAFKTCLAVISTTIVGPATVVQGSSASYRVIETLSDGQTRDVTADYILTCPDGAFTGGNFTPSVNGEDTHAATVTASKAGADPVTLTITIISTGGNAGVLVVDIYDNSALRVEGLIDNPEILNSHSPAFSGNNVVPPLAAPAQALILASDLVASAVLKWRFEFNIAALLNAYPDSLQLVFLISGLANAPGAVRGLYSLKTYAGQMVMTGAPGSYLPTVAGANLHAPVTFNSYVTGGAGTLPDAALNVLAKFTYDVVHRTVSCVTVTSVSIVGPAAVEQGSAANYTVLFNFSDGSVSDLTSGYTLSCPDGLFSGNVFSPFVNTNPTHTTVISASKNGQVQLSRTVTITNTNTNAGILVVDLLGGPTLNVIGLIDNTEVANNHVPAYTGHNSIPAGATDPASALILASDLVSGSSSLRWRFEFNIAQLLIEYPASPEFVFLIKGRGDTIGGLSFAFVLKQFAAQMLMSGTTGNLLPGVSGADLPGSHVSSGTTMLDGANGSYAEADLPILLKLTYHVASKTISYVTYLEIVSTDIIGSDTVAQHTMQAYRVIVTYSDGSTVDQTGQYTFSSPAGLFTGNIFRPFVDDRSSFGAQITATPTSGTPLNKAITITGTGSNVGILVVDLFSNSSLNVIALIDNAEVTETHQPVYSGHNLVPALPASAAATAWMLASDLIDSTVLKWRFEFNIAGLISRYPLTDQFVFYIKGRGSVALPVTGQYSLKNFAAQMTLSGSPGNYLPSVLGSNLGSPVAYRSQVLGGANGSHLEADLYTLCKLVYHVVTRQLTCVTVTSVAINGPASVAQGTSAPYTVLLHYSDQSTEDITAHCVFNSADGTFSGNTFTPFVNETGTHQTTINAVIAGSTAASAQVTVTSTHGQVGIIVVDLFTVASLDVIGVINNSPNVMEHIVAYTGHNIVPAGSTPAQAYVLASDLVADNLLKWRFEFNVARLATEVTGPTVTLQIKGRGRTAGLISGAYNTKNNDTVMVMTNPPGSYVPSVSGGQELSRKSFTSHVVSGANGSHAETDLTTILQLVYNLDTGALTATTY
ncbi:hypothetical protein BEL04_08330 [Mucilaginibacter sp. PPCGB 2223]|uniref:hypothetical protein n=1 Tax=Mucilaginibacter sp. PPCGB 2223 TaxID=1886027 RepID=UPI000826812B|nr:hypothetical protein [Mucilaginibacter sp. PPCGB 2223]OCX54254.1 hypothetical protein BEL04_08330 [Mucilaginibacter sp. PPCGB 2223]